MTKRLVDIDDDLLERARAAAGTKTIKATVAAGLKHLADRDIAMEHVEWLCQEGSVDLEAIEAARQSRHG